MRLGCRSVAFTYNDPVVFFEYAIDVAIACRRARSQDGGRYRRLHGPRSRVPNSMTYMDAANVDLKGFTEEFYQKLCSGHLEPVLDTLCYLRHETNVWLEITTLLIPGENDSENELHDLARWIADRLGVDVPLHFSAFHPDWKMTETPRTPPATLTRARSIALGEGLRFVYTGNVHDTPGGTTWCPGCGGAILERDWYRLGAWNLRIKEGESGGFCCSCGAPIPGLFEPNPGTWGPSRLPVRLQTSTT